MAKCSHCGGPLGEGLLAELCPRCMIRGALDESPESDAGGPQEESVDPSALPALSALDPGASTRFGDYELLGEIAHGGMGVVYRAHHTKLDRTVALKMLLLGIRASPEAVQRFQREAQAAARLRHPGIVAIHEVGEVQGQAFFAMDLVEGRNLAQVIGGRPLNALQAATYARSIAEAVHYAHQHGILHRDLKPSNVLIDSTDDQVRLTDFGLAKQLEQHSDLTLSGQVLGSPNHMSPEMAAGKHQQVGPPTDIYSLGAILYELLTGRPPFLADSMQETLLKIRDVEPLPPRVLNRRVPRDLETICLKCLQKEPAQRYPRADEVAAELDRFLNGQPIRARPIGAFARALRWCRRKPALAAALGVVVTLAVVSTMAAVQMAIEREGRSRELYRASIQLAERHLREGDVDLALDTLLDCPRKYRHWEWGYLVAECHREVRVLNDAVDPGFDLSSMDPESSEGQRWTCRFDRSGSRIAALHPSGQVWIWEVESGKVLSHLECPAGPGVGVRLTPDWSRAVYVTAAGVELATLESGSPVQRLDTRLNQVRDLVVSPDGTTLAALGLEDQIQCWNLPTGDSAAVFATLVGAVRFHFTPDGKRLVVAGSDRMAVYEASSGRLLHRAEDGGQGSSALFPSPEGDRYVTADAGLRFQLWSTNGWEADLGTARADRALLARTVNYSPDGRWLCTGGDNTTASVRDAVTGKLHMMLPAQTYWVRLSPDGRQCATLGGNAVIRIWSLDEHRELMSLKSHRQSIHDLAYSPDGRLLASVSELGHVKVWSARLGREWMEIGGYPNGFSVSSEGRYAAVVNGLAGLVVLDTHSGAVSATLDRERRPALEFPSYSPDGRRLAVGTFGREITVWEPATGQLLQVLRGHTAMVYAVNYSPDGRFLLSASFDGTGRIWDAATGVTLRILEGHTNLLWKAAWSCDGTRAITTSLDGTARIWDAASGECLHVLRGHTGVVTSVTVSPDNRTLVTGGQDQTVRFWDLRSGRLLRRWALRAWGTALNYSPDGERLLVRTRRGGIGAVDSPSIEVWDVLSGQPLLVFRGHLEVANEVRFSPDGRRIVADWWDTKVRQWESFPWREEEYPEVDIRDQRSEIRDQRSEIRGQRSEIRGQRSDGRGQSKGMAKQGSSRDLDQEKEQLALRIRRYADRYWTERLEAEWQGTAGEPVLRVMVPWDRSLVAPRDPDAPANLIDLTAYYTSPVQEMGHPYGDQFGWQTDLRLLPRGIVSFNGMAFDIRGILQLSLREEWLPIFAYCWRPIPERIDAIAVGRRFRRWHALLGTVRAAPEGRSIGSLVWHYADGSQHVCPIDYGRHVRSYWTAHDRQTNAPLARLAYEGADPSPHINPIRTRLRLYQSVWDNPRPDLEVVSFDFVSAMTSSAPFLIAVTVE